MYEMVEEVKGIHRRWQRRSKDCIEDGRGGQENM